MTSGDCVYQAIDPYAFSYSENPDITNAYWVNGNFKPGGSFMLLGKAIDFSQVIGFRLFHSPRKQLLH